MNKFIKTLTAFTALAAVTSVGHAQAAREGETHVAVEMSVFDVATKTQGPGTHLNAPGDTYRYTYVIDNEYSNSDKYELVRAIFGVHIIDPDYDKDGGDKAPEWGSITIDGTIPTTVSKLGPNEVTPIKTDLVEMMSDDEVGGRPPYIYDALDFVKDDNMLVLEVINLREDGKIDGDAPYGDFNVLRAGLHVYYKEKK